MKRLLILTILSAFPVLASAQVLDPDKEQGVVTTPSSRAIDTVDTDDKYLKIIIYEDFTWSYIDLGRPEIDTTGFFENWDEETIHTLKGMPLDSLPEEVDIRLVDEVHPFVCPIKGDVRSEYKWRGRRPHKGIDLPLSTGDSVLVAFDGIVRYVGSGRATGGYGGLVIVRHNNGLETYYGHLSRVLVRSGEVVRAGECIGLGGSTGHSTGPHLHFETRYMGKAFDPQRIADFKTGQLRDTVLTLKKHYFSIYSHYGQTDKQSKAASGRIIHTVKKGETLSSIARKYGTTVSSICKLNKLSTKSTIRVGQKLIVR